MVPSRYAPRHPLPPIEDDERRSNRRIPVALTATSRISGDSRRLTAEVSDLSTEGCKLFVQGLHQGDEVWVAIAHLSPMPATVRWVHGVAVGLEFRNRLHESVVGHLSGR